MTVQFADFTREEMTLAYQIAKRASAQVFEPAGVTRPVSDIVMDLEATEVTCPLNLEKLAAFDGFNFAHDIGGIYRHLNRKTGELMDCFVPRCALSA